MPKIKDIVQWLELKSPLALQENYDNAGLITGNLHDDCIGVLLSLDCTEAVVKEAIERKCNLIISHHPILFRPLKKLSASDYVTRTVVSAIKYNIALYAAHTNADNVMQGVNFMIARKLGLKNLKVLQPKKGLLKKLVVFVPESHRDLVARAVFEAGAGVIGNYDSCSFNAPGFGTFRGGEDTNPFVGQKNTVSREPEIRFETIYPAHLEAGILKALLSAHPYEEPAFDLIPLDNAWNNVGSGLIGELEKEAEIEEWLQKIKEVFGLKVIKYTPANGRKIKKVGLCGGSGSFLIKDALKSGCDAFLTSDVKYHEFFDAEGEMVITDIGHFESEKFTPELFKIWIQEKFINFAVHFSETETNPVKYFTA
ncbi:MAG: Nif3-like dinuclear metal center hexameric protein [Bacteroidia bacterium]|nr:Nif3-like dinuclear metal center hexameric protein [Bacteroidia bacterium]